MAYVDRGRTVIREQGFLVFVGKVCKTVRFFFADALFRTRVLHGYHIKNLVECRVNREFLRRSRADSKHGPSKDPIVSVIIPTYNRVEILVERTIPSVLRQTYRSFELIVIGDQCTDSTEERIKRLHDGRIRFFNLQKRGKYPMNPLFRWMVAGSVPRNKGLELARGEWIAPLDDDDEFSEDHLEVLLNHATKNGFEMVYGIGLMEIEPKKWVKVGSYPPKIGGFCHLSIMYNSKLKFLKYNADSWKYREPDDWNLLRRMKEAGVRIGFVDRVIGKHYQEKRQWGI